MMGPDVVISADGLGKRYQLGEAPATDSMRQALAATFSRAAITRAARALTTFGRGHDNGDDANTLWSLRDVTFDVVSGATLGIIGRNGAGKSTLLKILSRITPPTTGRVRIVGRVGSLLEVGTGFHPDLTGRRAAWQAPAGDRPQVRRDRRVRGDRAVSRHAGEALFERHVHAARLRGCRAP